MALDDVIKEMKGHREVVPEAKPEKAEPKKEKARNKTKEEIEAYRQRKMAEEEARYLKAMAQDAGSPKPKGKKKTVKERKEPQEQKAVKAPLAPKTPKAPRAPRAPRSPKMPKMLQPLEPLYLLKIPGLPKGDCIAVCLAHGVE